MRPHAPCPRAGEPSSRRWWTSTERGRSLGVSCRQVRAAQPLHTPHACAAPHTSHPKHTPPSPRHTTEHANASSFTCCSSFNCRRGCHHQGRAGHDAQDGAARHGAPGWAAGGSLGVLAPAYSGGESSTRSYPFSPEPVPLHSQLPSRTLPLLPNTSTHTYRPPLIWCSCCRRTRCWTRPRSPQSWPQARACCSCFGCRNKGAGRRRHQPAQGTPSSAVHEPAWLLAPPSVASQLPPRRPRRAARAQATAASRCTAQATGLRCWASCL